MPTWRWGRVPHYDQFPKVGLFTPLNSQEGAAESSALYNQVRTGRAFAGPPSWPRGVATGSGSECSKGGAEGLADGGDGSARVPSSRRRVPRPGGYSRPRGLRGPGGAYRTRGRLADCVTQLRLRLGPQTPARPDSAVSQLLSGWGAGINLSPPRSVQSQNGFHAAAGRAGEGARSGGATPVGFSKPLCAVAAGRARAAGEQGAAQSPQARAGGVGARR